MRRRWLNSILHGPARRVVGGLLVGLLILLVGLGTGSYAVIEPTERGLVLTGGRIEQVLEPGLFIHLFAPLTHVEHVNVQRQSHQRSMLVTSADKQHYTLVVAVDYHRQTDPHSIETQYRTLGFDEAALRRLLDDYLATVMAASSSELTLDGALADRHGFGTRMSARLTHGSQQDQLSPMHALGLELDAVNVLDLTVDLGYAQLLEHKAQLDIQIETEQLRRTYVAAQQQNLRYQTEAEAAISLIEAQGTTATALEAAHREEAVQTLAGEVWRNNPELYTLRERELVATLLSAGNLWMVDPDLQSHLIVGSSDAPISSALLQYLTQQQERPSKAAQTRP
jgi:regulator of protease activity HflC (stomatin/prohibitin superfamily)